MFFGGKTINDSIFLCENKIEVVIEISMLSGNLNKQPMKSVLQKE